MDAIPDALGAFDTQLYLAITTSRNAVTATVALLLVFANSFGLMWWLFGLGAMRGRGLGRRGAWILLTVFLGTVDGWVTVELLKFVFRRVRPFLAIPGAPEPLIPPPESFSFPSGDAALAFGAAVALGGVVPRLRIPAVLLATAVALARVGVGVHYPFDVLGGAAVGVVSGLLAPRGVDVIRRQLRWRAYVVAHTHWDREWYERFEGYRARLVPMVGGLLDILDGDPRFSSFTFDGQTIAIEDHLAVRPADRPRIAAHVQAGRLLIGPWYVLADLLLVSGESLLRNLEEGLRVAATFGRAMRVAYVADPFGHPAQLPQVLRGFGYTSYVFARGVGDEGTELGSEFWWESPSGDRVLASHQVAHYANARPLVGPVGEDPPVLRARVARVLPRILDRTAPYASGDALLFMVGDDHLEAYPGLPNVVDAIRTLAPRVDARIASLEQFIAALPAPRGTFVGEMVSGKYRPILRGVNSTRAWIKQENAACERLLVERCEPLDAFAGGVAREEIRGLWRTLLQNHPHDSICGCSIDAVHDLDMAPRFARVREVGDRVAATLAALLGAGGQEAVAWSTLPWEREAVVNVDGVPTAIRCAAMGTGPVRRARVALPQSPEDGVIENEALRVEVGTDASFVVVDRASGTRSGPHNVLLDEGDRGDEYTYSYAGPTVGSRGVAGRRSTAVSGDRAEVTVLLALPVPCALRADRLARTAETVDCPVRAVVSLDAGSRRVDVALHVDNRARDHRLRVLCETGGRSTSHVASAAFAWLERPNRIPSKRGWIEPPTETRALHDLVAVERAGSWFAVGVDGLREYAVLHDGNTIAITLLRAVGWLSRSDLRERRGGAGPEIETPSAQGPGEHAYRYTIAPRSASLADADRRIREWLSPPWLSKGTGAPCSFLSIEDSPLRLSAVRSAADGEIAVRLVNPGREPGSAVLRFARPVARATSADLREGDTDLGHTGLEVIRTAMPADVVEGALAVRLQPYEIGTWLVRLG